MTVLEDYNSHEVEEPNDYDTIDEEPEGDDYDTSDEEPEGDDVASVGDLSGDDSATLPAGR